MPVITIADGSPRKEPTLASIRRGLEIGQDPGKVEAIYDDTWGHLRAAPDRVYTGHILFAITCNREITILDWEFEDLCGGPWFPEHLLDFVSSKVPDDVDEFRLWRFDGTYRCTKNDKAKFSGKVRPMRVQYRFPAATRTPAKSKAGLARAA